MKIKAKSVIEMLEGYKNKRAEEGVPTLKVLVSKYEQSSSGKLGSRLNESEDTQYETKQ